MSIRIEILLELSSDSNTFYINFFTCPSYNHFFFLCQTQRCGVVMRYNGSAIGIQFSSQFINVIWTPYLDHLFQNFHSYNWCQVLIRSTRWGCCGAWTLYRPHASTFVYTFVYVLPYTDRDMIIFAMFESHLLSFSKKRSFQLLPAWSMYSLYCHHLMASQRLKNVKYPNPIVIQRPFKSRYTLKHGKQWNLCSVFTSRYIH